MTHAQTFQAHGFALIHSAVPASALSALEPVMLHGTAVGGSRGLLARPEIAALAATLRQHPALQALVPAHHVAVQSTYFEKSSDRNWLVAIHQDLSIPVAERVDSPSLRGWSSKEGALFVQAPQDVLEQLVAVRLHIDPCGEADGPLRVVPGSHLRGILTQDEARAMRNERGEVTCLATAGDALAMRPLALHASSKSSGTSRRRVLHFVYGPPQLPHGLRWPSAVLADAGADIAPQP